MVDWGFVGEIAGIGFGLVFAILGFLAIVLWLVGVVIRKLEEKANASQEESEE